MNTFIIYQFKFWRYLSISVLLVLALIWGSVALIDVYDPELIRQYGMDILLIIILLCGVLGIFLGVKFSTYTYQINVDDQGLVMKIKPPLFFGKNVLKKYLWSEIGECTLEDYYNGTIVKLKIKDSTDEFQFMNSVLKKSKDLIPFYERIGES